MFTKIVIVLILTILPSFINAQEYFEISTNTGSDRTVVASIKRGDYSYSFAHSRWETDSDTSISISRDYFGIVTDFDTLGVKLIYDKYNSLDMFDYYFIVEYSTIKNSIYGSFEYIPKEFPVSFGVSYSKDDTWEGEVSPFFKVNINNSDAYLKVYYETQKEELGFAFIVNTF
jgi:hypothetical protein